MRSKTSFPHRCPSFTKLRLFACALAVFCGAAGGLHAATITVTTTNDNRPGSLRYALASATDGDTIDASGISGTVLLTNGELLVTNSVDITGPGPDLLAVNGNAAGRVLHIGSNTTVSISSLTVTNGRVSGTSPTSPGGGGIYNDHATLTVSNCTITGNSAGLGGGGGIFNDGLLGSARLTVVASTLSGNHAGSAGGGGILNNGRGFLGSATLTVVDSTLNGNDAGGDGGGAILNNGERGTATLTVINSTLNGNSVNEIGGGISNRGEGGGATLAVVNCTLSSNSASLFGGGIYDASDGGSVTLTVINSTLNGNSARDGGGIFNSGGATLTVVNSTLGVNSARDGGAIYNVGIPHVLDKTSLEIGSTILNAGATGGGITNVFGTVTSLGYNLSSDDGGGFLTATGDQINTDPMLGALQDNGGPTFTHALLPGSPAINAGDPNFTPPPDFDQRGPGFPRIVCGRIDIGAFEVQQCRPEEQIDDLIALVQSLGLPSGTANSLIVKLQTGASAAARGNDQATCGSLNAFLNEVNAQNGKKLTASQAETLIADAVRIRTVLGCYGGFNLGHR